MSAWLLPISRAKCFMNLLRGVDDVFACTECVETFGGEPRLTPAAEAVTMTAEPATATAPTASPTTRRNRCLPSRVIMRLTLTPVAPGHLHAFVSPFADAVL